MLVTHFLSDFLMYSLNATSLKIKVSNTILDSYVNWTSIINWKIYRGWSSRTRPHIISWGNIDFGLTSFNKRNPLLLHAIKLIYTHYSTFIIFHDTRLFFFQCVSITPNNCNYKALIAPFIDISMLWLDELSFG